MMDSTEEGWVCPGLCHSIDLCCCAQRAALRGREEGEGGLTRGRACLDGGDVMECAAAAEGEEVGDRPLTCGASGGGEAGARTRRRRCEMAASAGSGTTPSPRERLAMESRTSNLRVAAVSRAKRD